mgnify:CR=1 FL=1
MRMSVAWFALALLSTAPLFAAEAQWPKWRGPDDSGSVAGGNYPVAFSPDEALWSQPLPGKGCSTPIVWDGNIYLTAPVDGRDALLAFDAEGKRLWEAVFGEENPGKHRNGSGANASPVTDGESVFVYFKSGTLAAVSLAGKIRWQTNLVERYGPATLFWDHGTSPVLMDDYVIMARMHKGESWLAAFDKLTGELQWKTPRNYKTPVEGDHGYTTPVVMQYQGQEALLVWGAEHLTIHDTQAGKLLWSCGNFNPAGKGLWPAIATPVVSGDMVIVPFGRNDKGAPRLHGVKLGGKGDVTKTNHVWKRDDLSTFVPSPIAYDGKVYLVGDHGRVTCLDPATGETIWSESFGKNRAKFYASPLIAGGKLYAAREDGTVFVASIEGPFKVLAENDLGESIIASPVPVSNRLLIRGIDNLYCFSAE